MVNAKLFLFTSTVVASVGIEPTKTRFLRPSAVPICICHEAKSRWYICGVENDFSRITKYLL